MFMKNLILFLFLIKLSQFTSLNIVHDISKLKLLQIVHRHGDRTPTEFAPNDPFKDSQNYWPENGPDRSNGQLTNKGKYRLYKLGQYIRKEYKSFLGDNHSPREVSVQSSNSHRCIESVQCLLSGAYPPQKNWLWGHNDSIVGTLWQPFPIETIDLLNTILVPNDTEKCPSFKKQELSFIETLESFFAIRKDFLQNITKITGYEFTNPYDEALGNGEQLWDTLRIELDHGYYWSDNVNNSLTKKDMEILWKKLNDFVDIHIKSMHNRTVFTKTISGYLIGQLVSAIKSTIAGKRHEKLHIHSTHDVQVIGLMTALGISNKLHTPFGTTVLLELHELKHNDFNIRLWFLNDTFNPILYPMKMNCYNELSGGCPLQQFFNVTHHWYDENFDKECNN